MCGNSTFKVYESFFAPINVVILFFLLIMNPMLMFLHRCGFLYDTAGVVRYPYPPMARPPFLPRPGVTVGMVPPLPRPPFLGLRPPVTLPVVRPPIIPVVAPAEKPQTTVYVGKIAPSVENDFIRSLLELCGPIKSWKRAQDPSDGTPRRFGFCEFETAEGVLRALRLLSKFNVDGEELVLNVNQATREYLERYVEKKKENLNKPSETGAEDAKKEGESAPGVEKGEGNEKEEPAKIALEEPKKDVSETENKENDMAIFGLVTDEDRDVDQEALEKLTNMIEERIKTKPPPPPPPPAQKVADGTNNSNSEVPTKSGDKDSDVNTVKNDDKVDDETTSDSKPSNRAGTESPDRSRRYDNRSRDRDRREKERELDRLERERERERARRERERDLEIQKAERFYKERVKEWETREKEREYERKREREKEKERERERRRLIAEQEDESDDDSRKRRRKSEIEDKRRRRRREKEEDMADRLKEEEEIVEAKKRAEEEQQRQQEKQALELPSVPVANGSERPVSPLPEVPASESKDDMEQDHDSDSAPASHTGDGAAENGNTDEPTMVPGSNPDVKLMSTKKLGFGLVGSGKRTAVPSVFHEEEDDDAQKEKKMRPLVPIDYTTEELQAVHTNDGEAPPISAASAESGKRVNPRDAKPDVERDRSRRAHDRSSHRDREHEREGDEVPRTREILDAKQLIDMIPKTKEDLFSYKINWAVYDENRLHERMRPWISKKITEFLGEEETTLVEFIVDRFREHVKAEKMLDVLQRILDEEAEMFVLKMWRMLIFEIKKVETGLTTRPGA